MKKYKVPIFLMNNQLWLRNNVNINNKMLSFLKAANAGYEFLLLQC